MIPIVVSTYPENGSKDMALNSPIKITFADSVDASSLTSDHIVLENLNDGRNIPLTFTYNPATFELSITPSDNKYGNLLLGLVTYRLSIANIISLQAESMQGLHTLEFTTVSDSIEDVIQEPVQITEEFAIVNYYPKQGSYGVTPNVVKIKCNKDVLESSVSSSTFMVTTDTVEDVNDIGFVSVNTVAGQYALDPNDSKIVTFTPTVALSANSRYTVVISGIQHQYTDQGQTVTETLEPTIYSFYTAFDPLYATLADIQNTYASLASIIKTIAPVNILEIIRENSEMAYWIAQQASNEANITWNPPAKIVAEYVKAKTRYDLVFDKYIQLANDPTAQTLGDLTIEYSKSLADLLSLADKLKLAYEYWENMLKGSTSGKVGPQTFRKGESIDEDPDFMSRQFKDWTGSKSW